MKRNCPLGPLHVCVSHGLSSLFRLALPNGSNSKNRSALGICENSGSLPERQTAGQNGGLQPTIYGATTAGECARLFWFTKHGHNLRHGAPPAH